MDTQADFAFLTEAVAEKFNPLLEGEYLVIQLHSGNLQLKPLHRGFDYFAARTFSELENLGSDCITYVVRLMQQGKLHHVDGAGRATQQSREQNWIIHCNYNNSSLEQNSDLACELEACRCSYPICWSLKNIGFRDIHIQYWSATTCLVEDYGAEIETCPNCGTSLIDETEPEEEAEPEPNCDDCEDWEEVPTVCVGCRYYNGDGYLVCTIHPTGVEEETCPDHWQQDRSVL